METNVTTFATVVCESTTQLNNAKAKAIGLGLQVKTGTGMIVPEELRKKVGETLKGTFTGRTELRQTRSKDGVYIAHQFSYENRNFFILGDSEEVPAKGTEFNFEIQEREIDVERDGKKSKETVYGFNFKGLAVAEKAPIIS